MLSGKLCFITGGGSGIGRATSQLMAKESAKVIVSDINLTSAEKTIALLNGSEHLAVELNVNDTNQVSFVLNEIISKYSKPPSILVNSAGVTQDNFLLKMPIEEFSNVIDINLKGTFAVTQAICNALVSHQLSGSVINIASIVGQTGNKGQCNYAASKAGVEAFTKTVAKEMGKYNIRCNAVVPGFIQSPMTAKVPEKVMEIFKSQIPLGRVGTPEEVAEAIVFLASERSSYINGASINVSGGL